MKKDGVSKRARVKKKNRNCNHELELKAFELVCNAAETKPNTKRIFLSFFLCLEVEWEDKKTEQSKAKQNKTIKNMFEKSWKINFYSRDFCYYRWWCCCCCFLLWCVPLFLVYCNTKLTPDTLRTYSAASVSRLVWFRLRIKLYPYEAFVCSFNVKNNTPLMCCSTYFYHYMYKWVYDCMSVFDTVFWIYFVLVWPSSVSMSNHWAN